MFVADASVVLNWCLPEDTHPYAEAANARIATEGAITVPIFWFELCNVLLVAERKGIITAVQTAELLVAVGRLGIEENREGDELAVLILARLHNLTFYDAAYLELAKRKGLALATLDKALIEAAKAEKIAVVGKA